MKTKFTIRCKNVGIEGDWWEEEERELEDETPQEWAERIIGNFNAALRPQQLARELLEVVILEENIEPVPSDQPVQEIELIARGYEWICPTCEKYNTEIEITEYVTCEDCRATYSVQDHHHAYG